MSCDALVVGAGPAGSTAAILLARAGWDVVLAERSPFPRRKVCGEYISGAAWPLLEALGVAERVAARAGPIVRCVGLFSGNTIVTAPMPAPPGGRAIGREHLDTILRDRAAACGVQVEQPCAVEDADRFGARIVIRANGSWRGSARDDDLLGFKAHFRGARLAPGLMPLVAFDGGYGGLVHTDDGRVSLSCCIRRDALARARGRYPGLRAGEALLEHVVDRNRGVREALEGARRDGPWLAAAPIRPAIRAFRENGAFAVGNAAGEAHPIVAEGISMAIQSSFLLCEALARVGPGASEPQLQRAARAYERAWRRNFAARVRAARLFAVATTHPFTAAAAARAVAALPAILTRGAHWSGKDVSLRRLAAGPA